MTLKRLVILLGILVFLAGVGIMCLWQYAYTPDGRARIIVAQLKGDTISLRGWMLKHHIIRPGYSCPWGKDQEFVAEDAMVKLGREVLPIVIEALHDENSMVRAMAAGACGKFRDPLAIQPLAKCLRDETRDFVFQRRCLVSLVQIGPKAYGPLWEASKECEIDVRWTIPRTVAQTWGPEAVPRLIEFLDNPDPYVRWSTANELDGLKDKRATDALIRHLRDSDANVARSSGRGLGRYRRP